jgi:hypothetical protein
MRTTAFSCSECERASSAEAWQAAWWAERSRRRIAPEWTDDDYGPNHGLDERMVCPRCKYVHSDDECSYVGELAAVCMPIAEPS